MNRNSYVGLGPGPQDRVYLIKWVHQNAMVYHPSISPESGWLIDHPQVEVFGKQVNKMVLNQLRFLGPATSISQYLSNPNFSDGNMNTP